MPSVLRTLLTLVCALYLGGAHWMVLQVSAWTGMLLVRAPEVGLAVAVQTTFDGRHPCRMCAAVSDGQQEEQERQPASAGFGIVKELKCVAFHRCEVPERLGRVEISWPEMLVMRSRAAEAPPTPPPLA